MTEKRKLDEAKDKAEIDGWFAQAREVKNLDQFHALYRRLNEQYVQDYGTCVHAITALAVAAAWLGNGSELARGGITGFQAGCVQWGFITRWMNKEGAMRLLEYRDMLYPQNAEKFERRISKETWDDLQAQASKLLAEHQLKPMDLVQGGESVFSPHPAVRAHWQSIVDGVVPFGHWVGE